MLETAALILTVVGLIFTATSHGSILGRLWHAFKSRFGGACRSIQFLQGLGRQQLSNDLQQMFSADMGLKTAVQQFYLPQTPTQRAITPRSGYDAYDEYDEYDEY